MKLFRVVQTSAPEARHTEEQPFPDSRPSQPVQPQSMQTAIDSEPTKADEMIRFMTERRDRHKKNL